jgi:hypothetical protein
MHDHRNGNGVSSVPRQIRPAGGGLRSAVSARRYVKADHGPLEHGSIAQHSRPSKAPAFALEPILDEARFAVLFLERARHAILETEQELFGPPPRAVLRARPSVARSYSTAVRASRPAFPCRVCAVSKVRGMEPDLPCNSRRLVDGPDRAPARSYFKAIGLTDEDLSKPHRRGEHLDRGDAATSICVGSPST